jgi:glycosyltransferase involved in cell wall biosynthesis
MLVLSHVLPFPASSGQRVRVLHTLLAARERFHVTFVAPVGADEREEAFRRLGELCDAVVLLPRRIGGSPASAAWHAMAGLFYAAATGLKRSNYAIGCVELSPSRVTALLEDGRFDCALVEYWHATPAARALRARGIPCLLDMHDVLWRAYERQLEKWPLPRSVSRWAVSRYRRREEDAWRSFDAIAAINDEEYRYVSKLGLSSRVFRAPMGVSLERWPYRWHPADPPRLAFYGGFGSEQNRTGARRCLEKILPAIWRRRPDVELWLVGGEPPEWLRRLADPPRIRVTGFVEEVPPLLATMTAVLCPWVGTYGFRSRLVEAMALGVPVVASPDAVDGMGIPDGQGALLAESDEALAAAALRLLEDPTAAAALSRGARKRVEMRYGLEQTYGRWIREVREWLPAGERAAS